jgi:uncharacterized protein YkwD
MSRKSISLICFILLSVAVRGQISDPVNASVEKEREKTDRAEGTAQRGVNKAILIIMINEYRIKGARCGDESFPAVYPLSWNDTIAAAAQAHSDDMLANDFYSHYGPDGSDPGDRLHRVGYQWSAFGENIARSEWLTEEHVVEGWINSPGHCKNIMNAAFSEMGIGRAGGYWTQVLAHPRPASRPGQRIIIRSIEAPK